MRFRSSSHRIHAVDLASGPMNRVTTNKRTFRLRQHQGVQGWADENVVDVVDTANYGLHSLSGESSLGEERGQIGLLKVRLCAGEKCGSGEPANVVEGCAARWPPLRTTCEAE